mmetsp:Transcript_142622/g.355479  ORF Transcript_142622/g.355479 Transcript_142622/m.355479 type:complete len:274 (+) Transcript_142622:628-1449(+)
MDEVQFWCHLHRPAVVVAPVVGTATRRAHRREVRLELGREVALVELVAAAEAEHRPDLVLDGRAIVLATAQRTVAQLRPRPTPRVVDFDEPRVRELVALAIEDALHERHADDREDHEDEGAESGDVAQAGHGGHRGVDQDLHLGHRVQRAQRPQHAEQPQKTEAAEGDRGDPLDDRGDDDDEVEHVPSIRHVDAESPACNLQHAFSQEDARQAMADVLDGDVHRVVCWGPMLLQGEQDGVDDDAEEDEPVAPLGLHELQDQPARATVDVQAAQ